MNHSLPPTQRPDLRPRPWWQRLPLLAHALAWLVGVALGAWVPLPWPWGLALAGALLLLWLLLRAKPPKPQYAFPSLTLLALAILGWVRYRAALPDLAAPDFVAAYRDTGREVVLVGVLTADPDLRGERANLRVAVQRLRFAHEVRHLTVHGLVLAQVPAEAARGLRYGDQVVLRGSLRTPPQGTTFSYRAYLARQGIYATLSAQRVGLLARDQGSPLLAALYALRRRALAVVDRLWPQPESGLLAGILLGDDRRIPADLYRAFRRTGTAHIIAISGFNITLIAGVMVALLGRLLGLAWGSLAAVLAIGAYTLLVGADAAVVRAALMGSLVVFARRVRRRTHPLTALAVAAALMTLLTPTVLADLGFQLSFAATWGLLRFAEPLNRAAAALLRPLLGRRLTARLLPWLADAVLLTLAAQLTTLPVSAWHFHRLAPLALIANPFILLLQAPLMFTAGAALIAALIWLPAGQLLALTAWPWVAYTIRAVQFFAHLPVMSVIIGTFGPFHALGYLLILELPALFRNPRRFAVPPGWVPTLKRLPGLAALTVIAALAAREALAAPDGRLHLWLLDTHGGETVLIRTPQGRVVLINGGADPLALQHALGRRLPLTRTHLDAVLLAATDPDNLRGLDTLAERYRPRVVYWAWERLPPLPQTARLERSLAAQGIGERYIPQGGALTLGPALTLEVPVSTPQGAALRLRYGRFVAVFPFVGGDEVNLAALADPPATVWLLAGHGAAEANDAAWLQAHPPRMLLLAVDPARQKNRPALSLLQALVGWPVLRTDLLGTVHLVTDGQRLWVAHEP